MSLLVKPKGFFHELFISRGMKVYQLEVLAGDVLLGQEAVDEVGGQEEGLRQQLHTQTQFLCR